MGPLGGPTSASPPAGGDAEVGPPSGPKRDHPGAANNAIHKVCAPKSAKQHAKSGAIAPRRSVPRSAAPEGAVAIHASPSMDPPKDIHRSDAAGGDAEGGPQSGPKRDHPGAANNAIHKVCAPKSAKQHAKSGAIAPRRSVPRSAAPEGAVAINASPSMDPPKDIHRSSCGYPWGDPWTGWH